MNGDAAAIGAEKGPALWIFQQFDDGVFELLCVMRSCQQARFSMLDHVRNTADLKTDNGGAAGHRFEYGVRKVILQRWDHEYIRRAVNV